MRTSNLAVTVVCEGAEREDVRITLVTMLSSLLDVGTNRVTVEKMK
ncbi:MAG: hypothetical protein MJ082_01480 [Clostridia bacterium]|nr:hypothetical protein [Clostridia bacterium]